MTESTPRITLQLDCIYRYAKCKNLHVLTHCPLGYFNTNLWKIFFKLILVIDGCDISSEIALRWTSLDVSDDKSTLVQVMAWCHQATSHYLKQCWRRSLLPYDVTRPQWVNNARYLLSYHYQHTGVTPLYSNYQNAFLELKAAMLAPYGQWRAELSNPIIPSSQHMPLWETFLSCDR